MSADALSLGLALGAALERAGIDYALGGAWFLAAELLACFKLLFYRPKDLVDLETLLAVNTGLDTARVRERMWRPWARRTSGCPRGTASSAAPVAADAPAARTARPSR